MLAQTVQMCTAFFSPGLIRHDGGVSSSQPPRASPRHVDKFLANQRVFLALILIL